MAAISNGWYKGSIPSHKITDIKIVNSYLPYNEDESWDGSSGQDGSIMCHRKGTKITVVGSGITAIGDRAFFKFLALRSLSGFNSITTIGAFAFCYTPNLVSVDIVPGNLTSIGESAFRMSSAEDTLDLSGVSLSIVGDMATRRKRWSASALSSVQGVSFPKSIYLNVPNSDNQENYPDIKYGTQNGTEHSVAEAGCTAFAAYHVWNCLNEGTEKQYDNWIDWYNATINADGMFAENNLLDSQTEPTIIEKLGWTNQGETKISSATQLQTVLNRLAEGCPTYAVIHSVNTTNTTHAVVVIGCDVNTNKLAFVDSAAIAESGCVSWLAFEDMFTELSTDQDRIRIIDYNRPMLAPNSTWFTQGGTSVKRASITEIDIKDSYTPTGTVTSSWDASADKDGSIMAYVEGTKLTIVGNGSGKILMNPDSNYLFGASSGSDLFSKLTIIRGANLLDASRATTMNRVFQQCGVLASVDVSNWRTFNVTSLQAAFDRCMALQVAAVDNWVLSSCTTIANMFQGCISLKKLDLSKWDVSNVTAMNQVFMSVTAFGEMALESIGDVSNWNTSKVQNVNAMFQYCTNLRELNLSNWDFSAVTSISNFLLQTYRLVKLTLGEKFTTKGSTGIIQTPYGQYIPGADGKWYDVNGDAYAPASVPNETFGVYYATPAFAEEDAEQMVLIRKGSLFKTGAAIRTKTGTGNGYAPHEFADAILTI